MIATTSGSVRPDTVESYFWTDILYESLNKLLNYFHVLFWVEPGY